MKKYLFAGSAAIAVLAGTSQAAAQAKTIEAAEVVNRYNSGDSTLFLLGMSVLLLMFIVVMLTLEIRKISAYLAQQKAAETNAVPVQKATWWHLFRMKVDKDKMEDGHEYDGIKEYDNNPPAWFNWLFYGTIAFGIVYMMYYHVLKIGPLQDEEYAVQMAEAEVIVAKAQEKAIELSELPPFTDEANITMGKTIYTANCAACHGAEGQGGIGPNLADDYYLHGGSYKDVFKVIFNGVPEKGMLAWKKSLRPDEIRAVSSYVHKMRGTTPPNPKDPQGEKYAGEATAIAN